MNPREFAIDVVKQLQAAGHQALWAGGCVRDQMLGKTPKDYDVATSALPDQVREVFGKKRTLPIGASFGVITVLGPKSAGQIEVATFREDGGYSDGRRPDSVHFSDAREDAKRRDFTINGMFFDPINDKVIDFVGGREDLAKEQIRAIGNPHERIEEDKLRMMRGVRFAGTFAFTLEAETLAAIQKHAPEISLVSGERIGVEMRRMLAGPNREVSIGLLRKSGLLAEILPDGKSLYEDSSQWDSMLVSLERLNPADFESAASILLERLIEESGMSPIFRAWKLSNDERKSIEWICKNWRMLAKADELAWSVVQPMLLIDDAVRSLNVAEAIHESTLSGVEFCRERLAWPAAQLNPMPFLDGKDLIELGVKRGPKFKLVLNAIRKSQLDGEIVNVDQAKAMAIELNNREG